MYKSKIWDFKSADFDKLTGQVLYLKPVTPLSLLKFYHFNIHFLKCVCECIQEKKTFTVQPRDKLWFDSTIRKTIRIRDRLRNIAMKINIICDWSKYKKVNNMKRLG